RAESSKRMKEADKKLGIEREVVKQTTTKEPLLNLGDTINVAMQDVISLPKYNKLDMGEAKVLYAIGVSGGLDSYKQGNALLGSVGESLYDKDYVEKDNDDIYILS